MDREKAKAIVSDPDQPATHTGVGFYVPTAEFQAQRERIAVMDEDTGGMLAITGPVVPGQWLLTFLGGAREVVSADDAKLITDALDGLAAAMAGDQQGVEAAFADLIGREPQLPDFLRKEMP